MRIFNEDPAFLVPGDLLQLRGVWEQVRKVTPPVDWEEAGGPFYLVYVRVESDPGQVFSLNPDVLVKVAR